MLDLLLRGARLPGEMETRDIGIKDGLISELEPEARNSIELGGALVTPALVEPHIHLDAVLTVGEPRHNESGSLFEGIAIWADRVKQLTVEDVKQRVRTVLRWQLANGVQFVRSHVDVCDPELRAVRALVELRKEIGDQIYLQLVAFPQQGIMSFEGGEESTSSARSRISSSRGNTASSRSNLPLRWLPTKAYASTSTATRRMTISRASWR